jgi:hypothetical protein
MRALEALTQIEAKRPEGFKAAAKGGLRTWWSVARSLHAAYAAYLIEKSSCACTPPTLGDLSAVQMWSHRADS